MGDVVILSTPMGDHEASRQLARFAEIATDQDWAIALTAGESPNLVVLVNGTQTTRIQNPPHGRLILLGDWVSAQSLLEASARVHEPIDICRRLTDRGWGRYLALLLRPDVGLVGVYRDPSGALDCFTSRIDGVNVITTTVPEWLMSSHAGRWQPNWDRVIDLLVDPTQVSGASAVEGWMSVPPGVFQPLGPASAAPPAPLWTPASAAASAPVPIHDARRSLVQAVDIAIAELIPDTSGCLVEVSGGLDSAIVAASLGRRDTAPPMTLVNYHGPYPEADERPYAVKVAEGLGLPLLTRERQPPVEIASRWMQDGVSFRPGFQRLDPAYDEAQSTLAHELGHRRIVTGKGGDAVFFQHCTPLVFGDLIARHGPLAVLDPRLFEVARWCRQSVWDVGAGAFTSVARARRHRKEGGRPPLPFVVSDLRSSSVHPWLADLDGVPPAKRMQIAALASNIGLHGSTAQTDACDVVHPLLSQPVLEAALSIPTLDLTEGGRDRELARRAFADRLPDTIRMRRTKGSLARYFGEAILHGLPELKPFLLEGHLAQRGYIDREKLEAALTADVLIWKAVYGDVMLLTATEAWVRGWSQAAPASLCGGSRSGSNVRARKARI